MRAALLVLAALAAPVTSHAVEVTVTYLGEEHHVSVEEGQSAVLQLRADTLPAWARSRFGHRMECTVGVARGQTPAGPSDRLSLSYLVQRLRGGRPAEVVSHGALDDADPPNSFASVGAPGNGGEFREVVTIHFAP